MTCGTGRIERVRDCQYGETRACEHLGNNYESGTCKMEDCPGMMINR